MVGLPDSVSSQLHLTHSAAVEFLRQFWMADLSSKKSPAAKKKQLDNLIQSLKRTQERMEAVRAFAVKQGGEAMEMKVSKALRNVSKSIKRVISLWEKSG